GDDRSYAPDGCHDRKAPQSGTTLPHRVFGVDQAGFCPNQLVVIVKGGIDGKLALMPVSLCGHAAQLETVPADCAGACSEPDYAGVAGLGLFKQQILKRKPV